MALNLYASGGNGGLFSGNSSPNNIKKNFQESPLGVFLNSQPQDNRTAEEKIRDMIASNPNTPSAPGINRSPAASSTVNFVDPVADDDPIMLQNTNVPMDSYELKMAGKAPKVARPETSVNVKDVNAGLPVMPIPSQNVSSTPETAPATKFNTSNGLKNMIMGGVANKDKIQSERDLELMRLLGMRDSMESSLSGKSNFDRMDLSPLMAFVDSMYGSKTQAGYRRPATANEDLATLSALNKQVTDYTGAKNKEEMEWTKALIDAQKNDQLLDYKLKSLDGKRSSLEDWIFKQNYKMQHASEKAPNGDQSKAASFAFRMRQAEDDLGSVMKRFDPTSFKNAASGMAPEFIKPEDAKLLRQAQENFINAQLRRESGAAISPSEFSSAERQYFPKVGDTAEVLEQKRRNRELVMAGMEAEAGDVALGKVRSRISGGGKSSSPAININQSALEAELARRGL